MPIPRKLWLCAAAFALTLGPAACDRAAETPLAADPAAAAPSPIVLPDLYGISCAGSPNDGGRFGCDGGTVAEMEVYAAWYDSSSEQLHVISYFHNLLDQPLGTPDGTTTDPEGVRVFLHDHHVLLGSGSVTMANADGHAFFTDTAQPYFEYDDIIPARSWANARHWTLSVPATVDSFYVYLGVSAAVQNPHGWMEVNGYATASPGQTRPFWAAKRDLAGNTVTDGGPIWWNTSDPSIATVHGGTGIVTAVAPGTVTITAYDSIRSGTATFTVTCDTMAVGAVRYTPNTGGCVGGGAAGAEFTVVPVNVGASPTPNQLPQWLTFKATGIIPVTGGPSPTLLPGGASSPRIGGTRPSALRAADAWELRLRRREQAELTRGISLARQGFRDRMAGARRAITPGTPSVGAVMQLNVETDNLCATSDLRAGRVRAVGTRAIVVADTMNPAGGLTTADYQEIANRFDALVWPTLTANFGQPEDIDANDGRVVLFFTRAVNELTPSGAAPLSTGFTLRRDLFPTAACATSNQGEMIYLAAADPSGAVNGNARSVASVKAAATPAIVHEMEHVINASRRIYVSFAQGLEEVWLDEGLAQVGEELVFHAASGLAPRNNLGYAEVTATTAKRDAFVAYAERNHARLREWLIAPHASGPFQADDDLATRGAAWAFLRYAADRQGGSQSAFWSALVNSTTSGTANVAAATGGTPADWFRDFALAMYADDAGIGGITTFQQPSWNFRALFNGLDYTGDHVADGYPLAPRNPTNAYGDTLSLTGGGGAAYLRMGVAPNGSAVVTLRNGAAAPPSHILLAIIRRK
jgi:hypothetical protein